MFPQWIWTNPLSVCFMFLVFITVAGLVWQVSVLAQDERNHHRAHEITLRDMDRAHELQVLPLKFAHDEKMTFLNERDHHRAHEITLRDMDRAHELQVLPLKFAHDEKMASLTRGKKNKKKPKNSVPISDLLSRRLSANLGAEGIKEIEYGPKNACFQCQGTCELSPDSDPFCPPCETPLDQQEFSPTSWLLPKIVVRILSKKVYPHVFLFSSCEQEFSLCVLAGVGYFSAL
jgi:hypothetical protein